MPEQWVKHHEIVKRNLYDYTQDVSQTDIELITKIGILIIKIF